MRAPSLTPNVRGRGRRTPERREEPIVSGAFKLVFKLDTDVQDGLATKRDGH